ncbi:MAG TPA: radical SAM protein [Syntrophorhabdaceae bacterium]|nr:radical SAM protein [Syntrophorhabdaceae bacterium]
MILLIHPPATKPCEPPAGITQLAGALGSHGIPYGLLDANLEGMLYQLEAPVDAFDTWTRRAKKNASSHLNSLRNLSFYGRFDRYKRAVLDLNRLLEKSATDKDLRISLADYEDRSLSPTRTDDLLSAAEHPEKNPFYPYFSQRLPDVIEKGQYGYIGVSLSFLSQALSGFAMIGFVKRRFPALKIIIGGGLVTSWMKRATFRNSFGGLIDYMVSGPGEEALLNILGKTGHGRARSRPAYGFLHSQKYLAPGFIMPYSSSSGCYWGKCAFCPEKAEGNRYEQLPARVVTPELIGLVEALRPALIHLTDNAVSPAVLRGFAENPPGAPWYGFARVTDCLTDPDFCVALKRSGCVMLKLGVESGNQDVLDAMHKGNDVSTTSRALRALSNAGIATYVYLLFGTPWESEDKARRTLDFTVKHSACIDFLNVAIFNLPRLSPESFDLVQTDFYEGDLSLYTNFVHPHGWTRRNVRSFVEREFRQHSAIKPIVLRQPPLFTSNHAPFFCRAMNPLLSEPVRIDGEFA